VTWSRVKAQSIEALPNSAESANSKPRLGSISALFPDCQRYPEPCQTGPEPVTQVRSTSNSAAFRPDGRNQAAHAPSFLPGGRTRHERRRIALGREVI
jgi:hypothetical protein